MAEHQDMVSELITGLTGAFRQWLDSDQLVVGDVVKEALVEALEGWMSEQPVAVAEIFRDVMQQEVANWLHDNRHLFTDRAREQMHDGE